MYIGPWQEYKLAQVIKVKNDLYEGSRQERAVRPPRTLEALNQSQYSHVSTPSTRTFSSEPVQRPYPTFAIDRYYEQWRKVEHIISQPNEVFHKPRLPKLEPRKRQGKSLQERRVHRMRMLYGIKDSGIQSNEDNGKPSFLEKIKGQTQEKKEIEQLEENIDEEVVESEDRVENRLVTISDVDIEESINHEGVDGLLKWVENLPDEESGNFRDLRSREKYIQI